MSAALIIMLEIFLTVFLVWFLVSVFLSLLYPRMRMHLLRIEPPALRTQSLFLYACLGVLVGAWALCLLFVPNLAQLIIASHCHNAACQSHSPEMIHAVWFNSLIAVVVFFVVFSVAYVVIRSKKYLARIQLLKKLSSHVNDKNYYLLRHPQQLAWNLGIFKSSIFVSTGLVETLTQEELELVLRHENTHLSNYDNFKKFIVYLLTFLWVNSSRKQLQIDYADSVESTLAVDEGGPIFTLQQKIKDQLVDQVSNDYSPSVDDQCSSKSLLLRYLTTLLLSFVLLVVLTIVVVNSFHFMVESIL